MRSPGSEVWCPTTRVSWARPEERVVKGRADQEMLRIVADDHVDLVVMGVQGKGAVNRLLFELNDRPRNPRGGLPGSDIALRRRRRAVNDR